MGASTSPEWWVNINRNGGSTRSGIYTFHLAAASEKWKGDTPGNFLKYTAHEFLKVLKQDGISKLYEVNAANKKYEIWQRDSLSREIVSKEFAKQRLDYIHFNPVSGKWNLAKDYLDYYYSSARFYDTGVDEFGFLNNLFHG